MSKAKPLPGRLSERSIRSTLNAIRKRLRDAGVSNRDFLKLVAHQERLQGELKAVAAQKLKAQIEELKKSEPAGTQS